MQTHQRWVWSTTSY